MLRVLSIVVVRVASWSTHLKSGTGLTWSTCSELLEHLSNPERVSRVSVTQDELQKRTEQKQKSPTEIHSFADLSEPDLAPSQLVRFMNVSNTQATTTSFFACWFE